MGRLSPPERVAVRKIISGDLLCRIARFYSE